MKKTLFCFALFLGCFYPFSAVSQVQVAPFVNSNVQLFDNLGAPCAGCLLSTFAAGTTTPLATYSDSAGTVLNANPIVLDSAGRATIYLTTASYKFVLKSALSAPIWTQDNVTWDNLATSLTSLTVNGTTQIIPSTAATSGANQSGPLTKFCGNYWAGSASAADCWSWQDVLGTGSNPTTTLTLTHSGSSGTNLISIPANVNLGSNSIAATFSGPLNGSVGATTPSTGVFTTINNKVMADQYASLSAAITALGGSGAVELPCGPNGTQKTYTISSTITIASDGVQIFGHGLCSNISVTTTSDVFQVTGALFQLRDLNITIGTSTSRNGSAIVHPTNSTGSQGLIQNVRFVGNASSTDNGIILLEDQTGTGLWRGSQWRIIGGFTWQAAVKLAHSSTLSTIASNQFDDISGSAGFTDAGFAFDGLIDTVTISNIDLEPNVTGSGPVLWLRNTLNGSGSGGAPRWVNCIACLPSNATASSTGPSVVLDSSRDFHMIGGTLAGPNDGLKIGSQAADTVISGVQFVNIGQNAIHVVSGSINTVITQNTFTDVCDTSGTFDVIAVDAGTTDFQITNNTLRVLFSSFKCRDGVNIASGTSNHYVVANNDFPSSALNTSQLVNAGTGADQVVSGMLGGTSTINRAPVQVASVDLTSQTAAIATTTLYTVVTAGQYRLSWDAKVTTAAGTSSTLGGLTIVYTDPDGSNVPSSVVGAMVSGGGVNSTATTNNTLTGLWGIPLLLNCKAGTNITYAMAYASNPANAMNYNLHIVLEKM